MIRRIRLTWRQNSSKSVNLFLFCYVLFLYLFSFRQFIIIIRSFYFSQLKIIHVTWFVFAVFDPLHFVCFFFFAFFYTQTIYKCKIYGFEIESNSVEKTTQFARWNMYNYYRLVTVLFVIAAISEFLLIRFI